MFRAFLRKMKPNLSNLYSCVFWTCESFSPLLSSHDFDSVWKIQLLTSRVGYSGCRHPYLPPVCYSHKWLSCTCMNHHTSGFSLSQYRTDIFFIIQQIRTPVCECCAWASLCNPTSKLGPTYQRRLHVLCFFHGKLDRFVKRWALKEIL